MAGGLPLLIKAILADLEVVVKLIGVEAKLRLRTPEDPLQEYFITRNAFIEPTLLQPQALGFYVAGGENAPYAFNSG
jgi:hypothetical protein